MSQTKYTGTTDAPRNAIASGSATQFDFVAREHEEIDHEQIEAQ